MWPTVTSPTSTPIDQLRRRQHPGTNWRTSAAAESGYGREADPAPGSAMGWKMLEAVMAPCPPPATGGVSGLGSAVRLCGSGCEVHDQGAAMATHTPGSSCL